MSCDRDEDSSFWIGLVVGLMVGLVLGAIGLR